MDSKHTFHNLRSAVREAKGELVAVPFPSPERLTAMLKAYAPGCGSPTHVEATNGGQMPCGGLLKQWDGSIVQYFCGACKPHETPNH